MLLFSIMLMFLLSLIIMMIGVILSKKVLIDKEKSSSYECGFDPLNLSRSSFSLQFFLIGIIFLIFDVEIVLMLPAPLSFFYSLFFCVILGSFIVVLLFGLYFEWVQGTLDWLK